MHEPKGVAAAASGEVYVADGAASGAWTDAATIAPIHFNAVITDISTAETVYIPIPYAGTVNKITTVLGGAIGTSDATITLKNSAAASMGTVTVATAISAAGDVDSNASLSNNTVTANDYITVETNGASTNAVKLWVTVSMTRS